MDTVSMHPQVEIDSKIKCFIPDFTPAIGTLDNFVKVVGCNICRVYELPAHMLTADRHQHALTTCAQDNPIQHILTTN